MLPSVEEINQRVLTFLETHEQDSVYHPGHNFYYAFTVDENDHICQERYGTNLMTRRGFYQSYYGIAVPSPNGEITDLEGNGFGNDYYLWIGSGDNTTPLTFTDEHMREKIANVRSNDQIAYLKTGYYNPTPENLNAGYLYTTYMSYYGVFDYQLTLPDNDTPTITGHTGGSPSGRTIDGSTVIDTRWLVDETDSSKHYFNITEIGLGGNVDYNNDPLRYHMILRDENGNPSPIRKYYNQKLFIYIYFTQVVPVTPMADAWGTGNYILYNPFANNNNVGIKMEPSIWQNVRNDGYDNLVFWTPSGMTNWKSGCVSSEDQMQLSRTYSEDTNGNQFVTWSDFGIPNLLIEDPKIYVSYVYFYSPMALSWYTTTVYKVLMTFDELDTPEEIVAVVYTNDLSSNRFDDQFGQPKDTLNRNGMLPMLGLHTIESLRMFNIETNEFDIDVPFYFKLHDNTGTFFNMTWMRLRTEWTLFACPDGVKRNVYVYFNYMAGNGGYKPYQSIDHFTNVGLTLFASDTPWNTDTWTQFYNINACGSETDANDNLLVKKRYFICYSDVDLWFTFKDDDYPKIATTTTNITNIDFDYHGMMIGDDTTDKKYIVIGSTLMKLNNDLSVKKFIYQQTADDMSPYMCGTCGSKYWYVNENDHCAITIVDTNPTDNTKDIKYIIINALKDDGGLVNNGGVTHTNNDRFIITEYKNNTTNQILLIDLASEELQTLLDDETITVYDHNDWEDFTLGYNTYYRLTDVTNNPIPFEKDGKLISVIVYDKSTRKKLDVMLTLKLLKENKQEVAETIYQQNTNFGTGFFTTTNENVKYLDLYTDRDSVTDENTETRIITYDNPNKVLPIIKNARKGFCIQGTNLMVYNDTTDEVDMHTWNVIDMRDPLDENGDPKVIDYFTINPDLIGNQFYDGMGFGSHVYVVITNKMTNTLCTFYYDMTTHSNSAVIAEDINLNILNSPGDYSSSVTYTPQYVGNEKCLVIKTADGDQWLRYIKYDDPFHVNGIYLNIPRNKIKLQLKEIDYGNNKKQLLLAYHYPYVNNSLGRQVYDMGCFLAGVGYEDSEGSGYFNSSDDKGYNYCMLFDNGIVTLDGINNSNNESRLILSPIARWVPLQLTGTTKCIQAYNNPILLSGKSYTWQYTNHMSYIGLSDDGASVYEE